MDTRINMGTYSEEMSDVQGVDNATILLDDLGLDLISDNISSQIQLDTSSTMDFLSTIRDKFEMILSDEEVEPATKTEIKMEVVDFCERLLNEISNAYDLWLNIIEESYSVYLNTLTTLYTFFIIDRYEIVEQFLIEYIETNKTSLIQTLNLDENNKDITSLSNKKKNFDSEDVAIMSGVSEIIDFITNSVGLIDSFEFIDVMDSASGDSTIDEMRQLLNNGVINGNFVPAILHNVLGDIYDSNDAARIRSNIRAHFYAKYN